VARRVQLRLVMKIGRFAAQLIACGLTLGCFFMITPTNGGYPAWVWVGPYNSRYACQDWEGACFINDRRYPEGYQGIDGVCTGVNVTRQGRKRLYSPGAEGGSCACNGSGYPDSWMYLFYPDSGGVHKFLYGDQESCLAALGHARRVGYPAGRKYRDAHGGFSASCFFQGDAHE
jgi:hypothetical protein